MQIIMVRPTLRKMFYHLWVIGDLTDCTLMVQQTSFLQILVLSDADGGMKR